MGYAMWELSARVRIPCASISGALGAIQALKGLETTGPAGAKHSMWVNSVDFQNATTLDDMLRIWRWPIFDTDEEGSITELEFIGERYGNEDLLFSAIAPFVSAGSEIQMAGEDGVIWRWRFDGICVVKEYGRTVFDDIARRLARELGDWPHNS